MAFLLNRNPAARFECLHALVKLLYSKFGSYNSFSLSGAKFERNSQNIHEFCSLLVDSDFGIKFCPYKQNPLDDAGCSLTNGVKKEDDTTKSKEVSNTINALHALGFVQRDGRKVKLTSFGIKFAKSEYGSKDMQDIIEQAVLNYGPIIGILNQIREYKDANNEFNSKDISVGYPNTSETVAFEGYNVELSAGSQPDANTRTRSCMLAWITTAGFIRPTGLEPLCEGEFAHFKYKDFLNQPHRGDRKYVVVKMPDLSNGFVTNKPLDYNNLTKLTAALRENNQQVVRDATMKYESRINNRRFAIIYFLNEAYKQNTTVSFDQLVTFFHLHRDTFLISDADLYEVLRSEMSICDMAGIPFVFDEEDGIGIVLKPLNGINFDELAATAPREIISILKMTKLS